MLLHFYLNEVPTLLVGANAESIFSRSAGSGGSLPPLAQMQVELSQGVSVSTKTQRIIFSIHTLIPRNQFVHYLCLSQFSVCYCM